MMQSAPSGADPIQVTLTPPETAVMVGGDPVTIVADIRNASMGIDQYSVEVEGLDPSWYSLDSSSVSLFPGESGTVRITIRPPADAGAAGPRAFTVRARSYFNAALVGSGRGTVVVAAPVSVPAAAPPAPALPDVAAPPAPVSPLPLVPDPPLAAMPPAEAIPAPELKRSGNGSSGTAEHAPAPPAPPVAAPRRVTGPLELRDEPPAAPRAAPVPDPALAENRPAPAAPGFVLPQSGPPVRPPASAAAPVTPPLVAPITPQAEATGAASASETIAPARPTTPVPPAAPPPAFVLPTTPPAAPKSAPAPPVTASVPMVAPAPTPPPAPVVPVATTVAETSMAPPAPSLPSFVPGVTPVPAAPASKEAPPPPVAPPVIETVAVAPPPAPVPARPAPAPAVSEDKLGQVGFAPPPPPRRSDPVEVNLTPGAAVAYLGGAPVEMIARIRNVGTDVDQYNMEVSNLDPAWYTVDAQSMSLFPGDSQAIPIRLHIPDSARPGEYRFVVRATSVFDARETNTASGKLDVLLKQAPAIEPPLQPVAPPPVPTGAAQPAGTLGVAPVPDAVRVTLNPATVEIAAGGPPVEISAAIRNPNPSITDFSLEVENLDRSWYSLSAPRVAVYPGDSAAIRIQLHPPATGDTRPGEYSFVVRARAVGNSALVGVTGGAMRVLPPVQRAPEVITITPAANWQAPAPNPSPAAVPATGSSGRAVPAQPEAPLELVRVTLNPAQTKAIAGAAPGVVVVNVQNASSTPEQYTVEVEDLEPSWYTVAARTVAVAPGATMPVAMKLQPPLGARSGPYTYAVRARSTANPLATGVARGLLQLRNPAVFQAELTPRRFTGPRGKFELRLSNSGADDVALDLTGTDPEGALSYGFKTANPTIPAKGRVIVPVAVRARGLRPVGEDRKYAFTLAARPVEGEESEALQIAGEYLQSPRFKSWVQPLLAALLLLLLIWFISPLRPDLGKLPAVGPFFAGIGSALAGKPLPPGTPTAELTPGGPVFQGGFLKLHDTFPTVIGSPLENETSDAAGNAHQRTSTGYLTYITGTNDFYFTGQTPDGKLGKLYRFTLRDNQMVDVTPP
jgi:uncharacterized membrane protein